MHQPIVTQDKRDVDTEHLLLLGDWYHRTAEEALEFYMQSGSFGKEPVPDSLLLNGIGAFNHSDAVPARPVDCKWRVPFHLPPLVHYRDRRNILRIVNVGAYAGVEFSILRAELVLYAVDGGNEVSGRRARSIGHLQPGERVDVLVEPSTRTGSPKSILHVFLDATPFKYLKSSLTSTHDFPVMWKNRPSRLRKDTEKPVDRF